MWPASQGRWISVAEEIAYRWLRYLPHRMEFKGVDDMWFIDGTAMYLALQACEDAGLIDDLHPYLAESYRSYNSKRLRSFTEDKTPVPARLYDKPDRIAKDRRRRIGPALAHCLDMLIQSHSNRKFDLAAVLRHAMKKGDNLYLRNLVADATGFDPEEFFERYIDPQTMPLIPLHYTDSSLPLESEVQSLPLSRSGNAAVVDTISLVLTVKHKVILRPAAANSTCRGVLPAVRISSTRSGKDAAIYWYSTRAMLSQRSKMSPTWTT